ncbi:hypothetical protein LINPERPRIM_LOCUS26866 [Linum perenne]
MFSSSKLTTMVMAAMLVTMMLATTARSQKVHRRRQYYHVHIMNELRTETMRVHCHCTDHDQGEHDIKIGSEYDLLFKRHVFRTNLWKCHVAVDRSRKLDFHAYDDYTKDYNSEVYWVVKEDGIYSRDNEGQDTFKFAWKSV